MVQPACLPGWLQRKTTGVNRSNLFGLGWVERVDLLTSSYVGRHFQQGVCLHIVTYSSDSITFKNLDADS